MKQCRLGLALDSIQALPFIGLPRWLSGKASSCQCRRCKRRRFDPGVGKIPWRRKWQPTPVFLSGKSHGQRSMGGCSPWGYKRVGHDLATKQTHMTIKQLPLNSLVYMSSFEWPADTSKDPNPIPKFSGRENESPSLSNPDPVS